MISQDGSGDSISGMGQEAKVSVKGALSVKDMEEYKKAFEADEKNRVAMNSCTCRDPIEFCINPLVTNSTNHIFSCKVDAEAKPVTNQKSSGRCWIFAALNVLRIPFMKRHQLEEFEFSQNFVFFYDKIERCNYFLHQMKDLLMKGEPICGRLIGFLLTDPVADGGQWDMVVNIIAKYGLVPKQCFPETFSCETSTKLNAILKSKIREYVCEMKVKVDNKASAHHKASAHCKATASYKTTADKEDTCGGKGTCESAKACENAEAGDTATADHITIAAELDIDIRKYMEELYRIIGICLGIPPVEFMWEYYDRIKDGHCVGPITPLEFYKNYVEPYYNIKDKVCLVHDPRRDHCFYHPYTVQCLGNMVEGRKTIYVNVPVEELLRVCVESIKINEPVWFGCEIDKRFHGKAGIQDLRIHDFRMVFGVEVNINLSKADRLVYGDSMMNHAMVLTAVSFSDDEKEIPSKWRVENSWGEDRGDKGYLAMTSDWFREFVFEVVVDKQLVSKEVLDALGKEPRTLPAWDPMGSLA